MAKQPWWRDVALRKTQREEYSVILGLNDRTVQYPTVVATGRDPLEAIYNAMRARCPEDYVKRICDRLIDTMTPDRDKARTGIDRIDAELASIDAGITHSRIARLARDKREGKAGGGGGVQE